MAQPHSTKSQRYTNPEVQFERTDVEYFGVVVFGIVLCITILLSVVSMFWFGNVLLGVEKNRKVSDLPEARVDGRQKERFPPEPFLEALEDLSIEPNGYMDPRKNRPKLYPPRAAQYYRSQMEQLKEGNPAKNAQPMEQTIRALAGKLPARSGEAEKNAGNPTATRAAAGRFVGGKP
ncbi:MAG: hypothetical protein ACKO23_04260 [Gemmataceae bacterium]